MTTTRWLAAEAARMKASDGFNPFPVAAAGTGLTAAAITAGLAAGASTVAVGQIALLAIVALFGTWAGWTDARSHRLPDAITLPMASASGAAVITCTLLGSDWPRAGQALVGALVLSGFYFLAAVFGDLGLGDVKLAAILGLALGYSSWAALFWGGVLGLVIAVPHALKARGIAARIPLGPYMVAGTAIALALGFAGTPGQDWPWNAT